MKNRFSLRAFFGRLYGLGQPAGASPVALAPLPGVNRIAGTIIRAGAFEFLAKTSFGEIRGRLADPESEPPDGTPVTIRVPAECIRIDLMSPDENAFAGRVVVCEPAGDRFALRFRTESGGVLEILSAEAPPECEDDELLYAWFFPEDATGA